MNRIALQPGYILHSRPYRDSSLILEVFTPEQGRLGLVTRGARRRSRGGSTSALLQPFSPLLLSFSGRSELKTLTGVEAAGPPPRLAGERLYSGLYLNELLVRLLPRNDPHPRLFAGYGETISGLAEQAAVADMLRRFEFILLDELGYGFDLASEGDTGEAVREEAWYGYRADCGLVSHRKVAEPSATTFCGADLLRMAGGEFGGQVRDTAKRLFRLALEEHLGQVPLKSRDLMKRRLRTGSDRGGGS